MGDLYTLDYEVRRRIRNLSFLDKISPFTGRNIKELMDLFNTGDCLCFYSNKYHDYIWDIIDTPKFFLGYDRYRVIPKNLYKTVQLYLSEKKYNTNHVMYQTTKIPKCDTNGLLIRERVTKYKIKSMNEFLKNYDMRSEYMYGTYINNGFNILYSTISSCNNYYYKNGCLINHEVEVAPETKEERIQREFREIPKLVIQRPKKSFKK